MADPNHKTSDPERRISLRTTRTVSLQHDGGHVGEGLDDDDEYMLALSGMVSDGFRPQQDLQLDLQSPAQIQPQFQRQPPTDGVAFVPPEPTGSAYPTSPEVPLAAAAAENASSSFSPRLNRSSISKSRSARDSFTLRHDGAMGHVAASRPSLSRVSSASTDAAAYLVSDGPYQGPTGPSHPYQMYSQDTRPARTLSIATTSTAPVPRPESEYSGPTGPSHPYSMYPQNPLEDPTPQPAVPAIPLGFTNGPDPYQRRIGPDGEDVADIIGPDGHTEELPPYTRYPDEVYARKIRDTESSAQPSSNTEAGPSTATTVLANVPPSRAIPGAGGIGLAARNPEFDSRSVDDAVSPQSRHSAHSFTTDSHHDINTAAATISEKPQLTKYQRFAKKKACGVVPYWAIGLTGTAILIVIVIVAAVIGTLFSHRRGPPHKPSSTNYQDSVPTVTVTYDATPIPTPSDLPALPQGTFGLPLNLNQAPNTCLNDTSQTSAWSCNIVFPQQIAMQLSITRNAPQLGKDGTYDVIMLSNASLNNDDLDDRALSYGAGAPLIQPSMNMELVNDTFDLSRGPAWFRMLPYNKTVVVQEGLLSATTSSKARRDGSEPVSFIPTVGNFQRKGMAEAGEKPWICTWPYTFVEIFIYAQQNSSYASLTTATITTAPQTATATASDATATSTDSTEVIDMDHLTAYPRAVKVKERRIGNAPSPYCVQVEVQADNTTTPVLDANGNQVMIEIVEAEHQDGDGMHKRDWAEGSLIGRSGEDGDMSDCGCMWFSS